MARAENENTISVLFGLPGHCSDSDREIAVRLLVEVVTEMGVAALSDEAVEKLAYRQQDEFTNHVRGEQD